MFYFFKGKIEEKDVSVHKTPQLEIEEKISVLRNDDALNGFPDILI